MNSVTTGHTSLCGGTFRAVKEAGWVRNPIDSFILAEIEKLGMSHAPEADRVALIRRVTYDLTGLPPTSADVSDFIEDHRVDAYERLVEGRWPVLSMANDGVSTGSTWLTMLTQTDSSSMPSARRLAISRLGCERSQRGPPVRSLCRASDRRRRPCPRQSRRLDRHRLLPLRSRELVGGNVIPEVKRQSELTEITGTVGSVFLE